VVPEEEITALETTNLGDYYYTWGGDLRAGALALGHASLYNHSYEPNLRYVKRQEHGIIEFYALRDIRRDEELTINYSGDHDGRGAVWFEPQD